MIEPRLAGRVALVTGANNGIGAATAMAADGAGVFITSYRRPTLLNSAELEEALRSGIGGLGLYEASQQQSPEIVVTDIVSRVSGRRAGPG